MPGRYLTSVTSREERRRLLLDAVVTLAEDLHLDVVLERIVEAAARLADARYAALGVLGGDAEAGYRLSAMIHHGLTVEQRAAIPRLPRGDGVLGVLIDEPHPLRLHEVADHPRSFGFPDGHPPMHSFLGVPVRVRGRVFGNLYLAEKQGADDFTDDDEEIVLALAAAAGVAIENARLYELAEHRERWLLAANVVSTTLGGQDATDPLELVAEQAREAARADLAWVSVGASADELGLPLVVGGDPAVGAAEVAGQVDALLPREPVAQLLEEGGATWVGDLGVDGLGPALLVALGVPGDTLGVLGLAWDVERREVARRLDAEQVTAFADQTALALRVREAREDQHRLALLEDRDRIGRDLHDHVIQQLFAVGLGLKGLARRADDVETQQRAERAAADLDETIRAIRRTIFDLAAVEGARDVQSEVTALVDRAHRTLKFRPSITFEGPVRTLVAGELAADVLAVLAEALSNAARHATPQAVDVVLRARPHQVQLCVSDDGVGLPPGAVESGLANMRTRAERRGGTLEVESRPHGGTQLRWSAPINLGG